MATRLPSAPPNLPGFSYVRALGSGGFADVFLYEQNMPRRQVAVKVLLAEVVTPSVRAMFQAEANLMAQLSAHPAVLTVYQASVASDGRPYLVMELCSPVLNRRYRADPLSVPEALAIGIKIAGAVETAHRAGVLHRDVKPSNILTTAYGHPVLSDFGIAATIGDAELTDAVGLSVPWSAPEVLTDQTTGTVASEVWALGATVYSLIAGRSPFEVPGTDNSSAQLISRIQRAKPEPIGREDVPERLEAVLRRSMSKRTEARQHSVLEFIRDLQSVDALRPILVAVRDAADVATAGTGRVPLLVKIAPDLSDDDVDAVADLVLELGLDGIVAVNTTIAHDLGPGGLSGPPLLARGLDVVARLRSRLGPEPVIIGVGGITTLPDAREYLAVGATLVQGYTGFAYRGPFWASRLNRGLADDALRRESRNRAEVAL